MAERVSLDPRGLNSALAVLQREQTAYVPTEREGKLYRWFNVCVYTLAAVLVLLPGVVALQSKADTVIIVFGLLGLVAGVLMIATVVLFFLNWGLMRKLYRHAQLRKQLKLADYFARAFIAERRTTAVGNIVTLLTTITGWLLIVFSLFGAIGLVDVEARRAEPIGLLVYLSMVFLVMFLVGVSFISFRYVRRGKQKLEVVLRLQKTLTEQTEQGTGAREVKLSMEDYSAIAALEREHIIRDRASSIASARNQADAPSYLYQSSRQMQLAKSKLSPELRVRVEGTITELLADPLPAAAAKEPRAQNFTIPVGDTGLRIEYNVDPSQHVVRLYDLRNERGTSVSATDDADGLS